MLNGKELGDAIAAAIQAKIDRGLIRSKADVAAHFRIRTPSIYDWIKKGSISKDKLPELWRYFSDVVGPGHWGLDRWPEMGAAAGRAEDQRTGAGAPEDWPFRKITKGEYQSITDDDKRMIESVIKVIIEAKRKRPDLDQLHSAVDEEILMAAQPEGNGDRRKARGGS